MIKDKKYYLKLTENWKDPMPEPVIEYYDTGGYKKNIVVVRDDLLEAGSKSRFLDLLVKNTDCKEWVFGGANKIGWGPTSLAYLCKKYNKKCTTFWAKRKTPTMQQQMYLDYGGKIEWVNMGMLTVTKARARKYYEEDTKNRELLPLGLEHELVTACAVRVMEDLQKKHNLKPDTIWSVGSSGSLNRSLQIAFPEAEANVVQVGHKMTEKEIGRANLYIAPYKYDKAVKKDEAPPFPSAPEYDAKGWKVMLDNIDSNNLNLFYNVAR
jgi:hypothetical protein